MGQTQLPLMGTESRVTSNDRRATSDEARAAAVATQTLLIDADDTLWENNVYFERAIAQFISFLNHQSYTAEEIRAVLNRVEHDCILKHGYGMHSFAHALVDTFEELSLEPITPQLHARINSFAHAIAEQPMEFLPQVPETLEYLAARHHLILVTKGNLTEQTGKIERSGLKQFFSAVEIVAEKRPATYSELVSKYALAAQRTWMVGNSPKSDINPALAAGLNAVFVPHGMTWVLEHEEVATCPDGQKLLIVESFAQMRQHF